MPTQQYAKCLVHKPGPSILEIQRKTIPGVKITHLMTADEGVQAGFFTVDCTWLWSGAAKAFAGEPHKHDFSHVIGFIGGHPADPRTSVARLPSGSAATRKCSPATA